MCHGPVIKWFLKNGFEFYSFGNQRKNSFICATLTSLTVCFLVNLTLGMCAAIIWWLLDLLLSFNTKSVFIYSLATINFLPFCLESMQPCRCLFFQIEQNKCGLSSQCLGWMIKNNKIINNLIQFHNMRGCS